jgi:hypothetical protein
VHGASFLAHGRVRTIPEKSHGGTGPSGGLETCSFEPHTSSVVLVDFGNHSSLSSPLDPWLGSEATASPRIADCISACASWSHVAKVPKTGLISPEEDEAINKRRVQRRLQGLRSAFGSRRASEDADIYFRVDYRLPTQFHDVGLAIAQSVFVTNYFAKELGESTTF